MANLYNVGDDVICQKLGGNTNKAISPPYAAKVEEVLAGGTQYRVKMNNLRDRETSKVHFKQSVVAEEHMTAA